MKRPINLILPLLVIAAAFGISHYLYNNKPEAKPRERQVAPRTVEATRLSPGEFDVVVRSYGTVQARTSGTLVAQVAGQVMRVAPGLRPGGHFQRGDVLLELDPRDYEIELRVAEAALVQARAAQKEEQARAREAERDWKRLGRQGQPSELARREPQLQAAEAAVKSALARRDRAALDLSRTKITAPYDGRVLEQLADLGQFLSRGSPLAKVYASEALEVRLPLNSRQRARLALPDGGGETGPAVTLIDEAGARWPARIVRSEAAIDSASRQLYVVAEVRESSLKIGQFLTAEIQAGKLDQVFVIPRSALRQGDSGGADEVLLVERGVLSARRVEVLWRDELNAVVGSGLAEGDLLNLTPLGSVQRGMRVSAIVDGQRPPRPEGAPQLGQGGDRTLPVRAPAGGG